MSKADDSRGENPDDVTDKDDELDEQDDAESEEEEEEEEKPLATASKATAPAPDRGARSVAPSSGAGSRLALVAVLALAAGGAAGWFGHQAKAKAALRAETGGPAAAGSGAPAGPCGAWQQKICSTTGAQSAACQQAQGATALLMAPTCEQALEALPGTLEKIKVARAPCDNLTTKLCKDLPPGSSTCQMVKQRTTSFPGDRCAEMLKNYDAVLSEVKMIDQQSAGGPMGGANPHAPPGAPPGAPGMPPGMPPQGMPPQGMPQQSMPPQGAPPGHP